jgi:hypothetical protein
MLGPKSRPEARGCPEAVGEQPDSEYEKTDIELEDWGIYLTRKNVLLLDAQMISDKLWAEHEEENDAIGIRLSWV